MAWMRSARRLHPLKLLLRLKAVGGAQLHPGLPAQPPVGGQGPLQVLPLQAPPRGDDGEAAGPCRLIPAAGRQDLIFRQEGVFLRLGAVVAGLGAKFAVLSALAAAPVDNGAQVGPAAAQGGPDPVRPPAQRLQLRLHQGEGLLPAAQPPARNNFFCQTVHRNSSIS